MNARGMAKQPLSKHNRGQGASCSVRAEGGLPRNPQGRKGWTHCPQAQGQCSQTCTLSLMPQPIDCYHRKGDNVRVPNSSLVSGAQFLALKSMFGHWVVGDRWAALH